MATLKCVIVGDGAVGKTCLILSKAVGAFPGEYIPLRATDFSLKFSVNGGETLEMDLEDTMGQADYDSQRPLAYVGAKVVLVCFAINNPNSFANLTQKWLPELDLNIPRCPKIIIGTKSDLRGSAGTNLVSKEDAQALAKRSGCAYMECSALTTDGLEAVFDAAFMATQAKPKSKSKCNIM